MGMGMGMALLAVLAVAASVTAQQQQQQQQQQAAGGEAITLQVDGVGSLTCNPDQEPADIVLDFTLQARAAGVNIVESGMNEMITFFCSKRKCTKPLPQEITLDITGLGSATVKPYEDPADVVEKFAGEVARQGGSLADEDMAQMINTSAAAVRALATCTLQSRSMSIRWALRRCSHGRNPPTLWRASRRLRSTQA
jgi:hypothetical protein